MVKKDALDRSLNELFDAERNVRRLHDELLGQKPETLLPLLEKATKAAEGVDDEDEASLRLVRVARLLGEIEGPRAVDALIDVLATDLPEARHAAGEELESIAFERFKEVALGVERALTRLPVGSPALPELPYVLVEVPEPGVVKLLEKFLGHADPDAVAAAIEASLEIGDPSVCRALERLATDQRVVEMGDDGGDTATEVTLGELATEALSLLEPMDDEGEGEASPNTPRRGGAA